MLKLCTRLNEVGVKTYVLDKLIIYRMENKHSNNRIRIPCKKNNDLKHYHDEQQKTSNPLITTDC